MAKLANLYLGGKFPVSTNRLNHYDRLFGQALFGAEEKTVDWTPVISVSDALAKPVVDYQCKITAKQTGTPSPQNICPIDGWTGANIHVNSDVITDTWQSEAGIVYGGVRNLTTGELTVTHAITDLGQYDYTKVELSGGRNAFYFNRNAMDEMAVIPNTTEFPDAISSAFIATRQSASRWDVNTFVFVKSTGTLPSNSIGFIVNATDYPTESAFKTAMDGITLCYQMVTPLTYTLTPTEITLAEGANTLWSDTGDSSMVYLAKR